MKIILFSEEFGNAFTTFIYNEAFELKKRGHEVLYLCCNKVNNSSYQFDRVEVIPFRRNLWTRRLHYRLVKYDLLMNFTNSSFAKKLNKLIDNFKPDAIHCHFGSEALLLLDNLHNSNINVFVTFHGYDASFKLQWKSYIKALRNHLSRKNVYPLFVNQYFRNNFEKISIPVKQSSVINCGIDSSLFKRKSNTLKKDPFIYLQVAGFFDKKGHYYTIQAFALLLKKHKQLNAKLILAGNGPTLEAIKNLVNQLQLNEHVIFPGLVDKTGAIALMEKAHAFVHHSIVPPDNDHEGIPTAIMEAMAMELPVISTYHSGIPELIKDGINGYLVNEKDIETYADKMWEITNWNYLDINRKVIEEKFELQEYISNLENIFSKKHPFENM